MTVAALEWTIFLEAVAPVWVALQVTPESVVSGLMVGWSQKHLYEVRKVGTVPMFN